MTNLNEAAQAMTALTKLPGLVLVTDHGIGDTAVATGCRGHSLPVVRLGVDLMTGPESIRYAVLAHELAHQELGHTTRVLSSILERASVAAFIMLACTQGAVWALDVYWWGSPARNMVMLLVLGVLWAATALTAKALDRRAEYEADRRGVELLNAAGFPGLDYMREMVADTSKDEAPGTRWVWILDAHPSSSRRLAAL
ncbi:M48 family metalloprotease [Nonomuraea sp. NPDC050786]|uniref:M48 family metalloprotease n=1 Tax=Nonomuraea sp. NPDC050786 TaxID=3154840 RepID=UPI0033D48D90